MFSHRTGWNLATNRYTEALAQHRQLRQGTARPDRLQSDDCWHFVSRRRAIAGTRRKAPSSPTIQWRKDCSRREKP